MDQIARSALRMGTMLGELQDFSRTRLGGTLHLERERVDIADLCEQVVREIRASTPDCRIVFSQAGNTVALASRERLEQLVSNLILNAVQHGEAGCDVHVFVNGQDRVVLVNVSNTGTAIPPDKLDRIFEPLYRTERNQHADMNRNHLGLGLYIARTIAIAHGGDIDVTSTQDEGTTFRVHLPREP